MIVQNIAAMATGMKQAQLQNEAGVRVARMGLDAAKAQGDALVEMIEMQKEIYAHLGSSVNTWV